MIQIGLRRCGVKHPELGLLCSRKISGDFREVPWKQWAVEEREVSSWTLGHGGHPRERCSLEQGWRSSSRGGGVAAGVEEQLVGEA